MRDDAVKIRLPFSLAQTGLRKSTQDLRLAGDESYYVGGFPRSTGQSRQTRGGLDSDGSSFFWTSGNYLKKDRLDEYFGAGHNRDLAFAGAYTHGLWADGAEGMSGGPVLNSAGEYVGIYHGFLLEPGQKEIPDSAIFMSQDGMRFIEIFSE
jgi:hypothetical protein